MSAPVINRDKKRGPACRALCRALFKGLALLIILSGSGACSVTKGPSFSQAPEPIFYTRVNIRYTNPRRIPSTNYVRGSLLPVGTQVRIVRRGMRDLSFVDDSNRAYTLVHIARHTQGTLDEFFDRMFSKQDPRRPGGLFDHLTPESIAHIEAGTVGGGMTREAVIMAYGYPPSHRTPVLEADVWTYWTGQTRSTLVFNQNRLVQVDGEALPHRIRFFAVSDPPGAVIKSEGRIIGKTPCPLTVDIDPSQLDRIYDYRAVPAEPEAPQFGVLAAKRLTDDDAFLVVRSVLPLSTAHQLGVRAGDRIATINGVPVLSETECESLIASVGFGSDVTVTLQRNGKDMTLTGQTEVPESGTFHARNERLTAERLLDMHDRVLFFDLKSVPEPEEQPVIASTAKDDPESIPLQTEPSAAVPLKPPASILGTGFVVTSNGYVVTSATLIKDRTDLIVRQISGESYPATLIRSDPGNDWSLLQADGLVSAGLPLGADRSLQRGADIVCAGFAVDPTTGKATPDLQIRTGTILSLTGLSEDSRHMQLALPIGGGYGGSPVLNTTGAWIGLISDTLDGIIHAVAPPGSVLPGTKFVLKTTLIEPLLPAVVRENLVRQNAHAPPLTPAQLRERLTQTVVMIEAPNENAE